MPVKLTKEEILIALKEGRVSYHPIGEGYLSPFEAREHLLKIADKLDKGELPDVDLSIAFDEKDTQKQQKITTHKSNVKTISNQNQHQ